jgi:hypothetical protein
MRNVFFLVTGLIIGLFLGTCNRCSPGYQCAGDTEPEGWTSEYNNQIKAALLPQITNAWLLRKLIKTVGDNDAIRDSRIREAKLFIISLNQ